MAKKKTGVGTLPHEIMMEAWRKEGRVHREELSLKAIKLDHRLQAREKHLDLDHVKELHGYVKDGAIFPPIIVFRIGGKDYVANGFHRCEAHKKEGRPSITADIVAGTWQEAVEFATCCNFANAALTPNNADKKKACFMLLDNGWNHRSSSEIARHVDVSRNAAGRWRLEWCEKTGEEPPKEVISSDGRKIRASQTRLGRPRISANNYGFNASINGKRVHVPGDTKKEAESELATMLEARSASLSAYASTDRICHYLLYRGIHFEPLGQKIKGLRGGRCRNVAVSHISEDFALKHVSFVENLLVAAVGSAMLLGEYCGLTRKVVLVFEPVKSYGTIVGLARRLGIEFMTLEQFVEAAKADEASTD